MIRPLLVLSAVGCASAPFALPDDTAVPDPLPDGVFVVDLDTTVGPVVLQVHEAWAPRGAARLRELVEAGFYDDTRFFRVAPDFVIQFGISGDPTVSSTWVGSTFPDDPVVASNVARTVSFATSGPDSRTTQLFVNIVDNQFLDRQGFAPIGWVIEGMERVRGINPEHGEQPDQIRIQTEGNAYLDKAFPGLDGIVTATVRAP